MQNSCFTIRSFCDFHKISRSHFYDLVRQGNAPKLMKIGRRVVIRPESAEAWQLEREAQTDQTKGGE